MLTMHQFVQYHNIKQANYIPVIPTQTGAGAEAE